MASKNNRLPRLYGHTPSQPSRTLIWLMLIKGLPFELRFSFDPKAWEEEISALNAKCQAPIFQDGDFTLYEMPAIISYLCEKHGWYDLFPQDLQTNSLIHQYFHYHHSSVRVMTMKMMAPHVIGRQFLSRLPVTDKVNDVLQFGVMLKAVSDQNKYANSALEVEKAATMLEQSFFQGNSRFICGEQLTVADLAAYGEFGQLEYANLYDFSAFEKIAPWIKEMKKLPFYDVVHKYNRALGDIKNNENTILNFTAGLYKGGRELKKNGVKLNYTYFDIKSFIMRKIKAQ